MAIAAAATNDTVGSVMSHLNVGSTLLYLGKRHCWVTFLLIFLRLFHAESHRGRAVSGCSSHTRLCWCRFGESKLLLDAVAANVQLGALLP